MRSGYFILACDERGTTRWPSPTQTWSLGGFVFEQQQRELLVSIWGDIKTELCGDEEVELKWSHFFPGNHQEHSNNPLLETNPEEWRVLAVWALQKLFDNSNALPFATYVRKNEASDETFRTTPDGRKVLDVEQLWLGVLGQFASFLKVENSTGEIWFDRLGSENEQARKQEQWSALRNAGLLVFPKDPMILKAISSNLKFFDSKTEPIIQIADFLSGVAWAASEGDEIFLRATLDRYLDNGRRTFRMLKIE